MFSITLNKEFFSMKKAFVLLIIVAFAFVAQAAFPVASVDPRTGESWFTGSTPADVKIINLVDNVVGGTDSMKAADTTCFYGPISLCEANGQPMYSGFQIMAEAGCMTSGDSFEIAYQIIGGNRLADTNSTWTVIDTCASGGKNMTWVSLASLTGRAIVFRIYNVDSSVIELKNWIRAVFKKGGTFNLR
jgi:hypothetical protein